MHHNTEPHRPETGLVLCDISGRNIKTERRTPFRYAGHDVEVTVYADLLKVRVSEAPLPSDYDQQRKTRRNGRKKPISEFTRKSRKNMLEKLAMTRNPMDGGIFVTLTYPGLYTHTPDEVKAHLFAIRKRLLRRFPKAAVFWRLELKERLSGASQGQLAPHFHFLVFGVKVSLRWLRKWFALAWNAIVAPGDIDHLKACSQVDYIRSRRHAMYYASKYLSKPDSYLTLESISSLWGRWWGYFGAVDLTPALTIRIKPTSLKHLRRISARLLKSRGSRYARFVARQYRWHGWTVFGLGDQSNQRWSSIFEATVMTVLQSI